MGNVIEVDSVSRYYSSGPDQVKALDQISFKLGQGESMAIIGTSGSGKTTLLNLLGGLDKPTSGKIVINGQDINELSDNKLSKFRNKTIGFVFQFFNLHEYLTAAENVALPLWLNGKTYQESLPKARKLLERVGLSERTEHRPKQLSGGEMQRVAIARALANEPKMILADEPTANLDKGNAEKVMALFDEIAKSGVSILMITHDENMGKQFKNRLHINKGEIHESLLKAD